MVYDTQFIHCCKLGSFFAVFYSVPGFYLHFACGIVDVRAEPILVVTCDVRVCGAFSGFGNETAILHIFGNNERTDD